MTIVRDLLEDGVYTIDGCDKALIGTTEDCRAVYAWHLLVMVFMEQFHEPCPHACDCEKEAASAKACGECECECDPYTMAVEWIDYNIYGALGNYGDKAPVIIDLRSPFGGYKKEQVDAFFPQEYAETATRMEELLAYLEEHKK
jgi:hypothetical protein